MPNEFMARPPLFLGGGSGGGWRKQVRRMLGSLWRIVWQTLVPFNPQPEAPDPIPNQSSDPDENQVKQCQWIFDQSETRRSQLEQKAQWTFGLLVFLTPLVASVIVFLIREGVSASWSRTVAFALLSASAGLMLMAFISIMRAVSIQGRESLYLGSVIDLSDGKIRKYDKTFHAGGLLYCASVNTAMNDHLAQFVKGAHQLTSAAVVVLLLAIIPASIGYANSSSGPTKTEIVGPVTVSAAELRAVADGVAKLRLDLAAIARHSDAEHRLAVLESTVARLEAALNRVPTGRPASHRRHAPRVK